MVPHEGRAPAIRAHCSRPRVPRGDHAPRAVPHVPGRQDRRVLVRRDALAGWRGCLPPLRVPRRPVRREAQDHALPLPRLPQALQCAHGHGYGGIQPRLAGVGDCDLPAHHVTQGRVQHEAAPRPRHHADLYGTSHAGSARRARRTVAGRSLAQSRSTRPAWAVRRRTSTRAGAGAPTGAAACMAAFAALDRVVGDEGLEPSASRV